MSATSRERECTRRHNLWLDFRACQRALLEAYCGPFQPWPPSTPRVLGPGERYTGTTHPGGDVADPTSSLSPDTTSL